MTWRWHVLGGLIAYGVGLLVESFVGTVGFVETIPFLTLSLFGALFPDIDTTSKVRKLVYTKWLIVFFAILIFLNPNPLLLIFACGITLLPFLVRHRGLFHNVFFLAALAFVPALVLAHYFSEQNGLISTCACFFFLGTLSHVILDHL